MTCESQKTTHFSEGIHTNGQTTLNLLIETIAGCEVNDECTPTAATTTVMIQ